MAQKIIITAKSVTSPPADGSTIFVGLDFGNTLGSYLNTNVNFTTGASNFASNLVKYNHPTTAEFIQDLKEYFDFKFTDAGVPFTSTLISNTIEYLLGNNATVDYFDAGGPFIDADLWSLFREDFTFPVEPTTVTYEDSVILSRSPYFFKASPTVLYDSMALDIYIYRGEKTTDKPLLPTFQTSKFVIQAGQPTISIDVHKLVNDFVQNEFNQTISLGVQTTNQLDTVWVYIDAGIYLDGVLLYNINQNLIALDGFGYHQELANPSLNKKVLSSINNHIIYNNSKYPLYFIAKDLVSITINGTVVPFTLDENFNNQYIGYVDVNQYAGVNNSFDAVFVYDSETITHSFTKVTECRNNLINCIFKNKFGFWQKIPFNKLSKKSLEVEGSDYSPFISDFGSYSLNQHNKRSYLTNGTEKVICNTDFLPEEYNLLFKELMLSEQIYLEEDGVILPVNIDSKSFSYKTKLDNKLIQYTMNFTYSFKTINNVV
jgi:hypothetical protein